MAIRFSAGVSKKKKKREICACFCVRLLVCRYHSWMENKEKICASYGEEYWRVYEIFLGAFACSFVLLFFWCVLLLPSLIGRANVCARSMECHHRREGIIKLLPIGLPQAIRRYRTSSFLWRRSAHIRGGEECARFQRFEISGVTHEQKMRKSHSGWRVDAVRRSLVTWFYDALIWKLVCVSCKLIFSLGWLMIDLCVIDRLIAKGKYPIGKRQSDKRPSFCFRFWNVVNFSFLLRSFVPLSPMQAWERKQVPG